MSNHSSKPFSDDALKLLFGEPILNNLLGATNKYPEGKLTPDDEGEIKIGIAEAGGKIIMNFGKPVAWIGFTREQAKEIGAILLRHARVHIPLSSK